MTQWWAAVRSARDGDDSTIDTVFRVLAIAPSDQRDATPNSATFLSAGEPELHTHSPVTCYAFVFYYPAEFARTRDKRVGDTIVQSLARPDRPIFLMRPIAIQARSQE